MRRRSPRAAVTLLAILATAPAVLIWLYGGTMVMPPQWMHFYGVGATAFVAAIAAATLTTLGARRGDPRTVVMAGGFTIMATLLGMHGLFTPGVLVGMNGVVAITGGTTLPIGAAVLALTSVRRLRTPSSIPLVIAGQAVVAAAIVALCVLGLLEPQLVPAVPEARSPEAWALLAVGFLLFGGLALRAANTYLLTRRVADLAVVVGLVLLCTSLYGALALTFMDLGWWLGHAFELVGIALVGGSVAYDLRRGSQSRPLVGDLRACELVAAEEEFFGARVRALMVRLARQDKSTEAHTRRVAALAVEIGEELGLSSVRLRALAIGGLLHDIGKLSVPRAILQRPGPLDDGEFEIVKRHPERGRELLAELGGFDATIGRLVLDHHERLDGSGYPHGLRADELDLETRILAVCDVYDALVSPRVYRPAWPRARATRVVGSPTAALTSRSRRRMIGLMQKLSVTTIGAVCAILTTAVFVLGVIFMASSGIVGFYEALRDAGPAMIFAPILAAVGLTLVTISHLIPIAMAYELVPGYVDGDAATKASLAVTSDTLAILSRVTNYAGNALGWGVAIPLYAYAIFKTNAVPRWIGWLGWVVAVFAGWLSLLGPASTVIEGVTFIGFLGFFIFLASMGVALLRRRPESVELLPASAH